MPEEEPPERLDSFAMALGLAASVLVTGLILSPLIAAYLIYVEPLEKSKQLDVPDWVATLAAFAIIGLYLFVAQILAVRINRKYFK